MAVPTWKQTASKLDAFAEAVKLRHIITQMIMRNFGLKREKYDAIVGRQVREKYPELKRLIAKIDAYQNEVEKARLLTGTGRVVMRPDRGTITRERRKLKALRRKLDAGEIVFADVRQAYNSWRGHIKHFDSYRTMRNMDKLFHELFSEEIRKERSGRNGSKKSKNYRGEFKQYDFPERIDPAERRHRIERGSERDDIRKRGSGS